MRRARMCFQILKSKLSIYMNEVVPSPELTFVYFTGANPLLLISSRRFDL